MSKDTFALDYCAPLSAMQVSPNPNPNPNPNPGPYPYPNPNPDQAFAIAMTSFSELQRRFARGIPGLGGSLRSNDSDSD